jgi:hypothetical protein
LPEIVCPLRLIVIPFAPTMRPELLPEQLRSFASTMLVVIVWPHVTSVNFRAFCEVAATSNGVAIRTTKVAKASEYRRRTDPISWTLLVRRESRLPSSPDLWKRRIAPGG